MHKVRKTMLKVHHIGYLVKKISKAEKDFATLGFGCVASVIYDPLRDADISFWEKDGYCVELVSPRSEKSVVYDLLKKFKNSPYHICYSSTDMSSDIEELSKNGYMVLDEPMEAVAIENKKVCFLISANSGMIELLEAAE